MKICSVCQKNVQKCYIVCDNDCGRKYCSDACADADLDHSNCTNLEVNTKISIWQTIKNRFLNYLKLTF